MYIVIRKPEELALPPGFDSPEKYIKHLWQTDHDKWLELASNGVFDSYPSSYDPNERKEY